MNIFDFYKDPAKHNDYCWFEQLGIYLRPRQPSANNQSAR